MAEAAVVAEVVDEEVADFQFLLFVSRFLHLCLVVPILVSSQYLPAIPMSQQLVASLTRMLTLVRLILLDASSFPLLQNPLMLLDFTME